MKSSRALLLCAALSPLLGCPTSSTPSKTPPPATPEAETGGQVVQQQQTPDGQPASRPAGHPPAGHPGGATSKPTGPLLTFSLAPKRTVKPRIDVTLERLALVPMTKEHIAAEPIDLSGVFEPLEGQHYVAVVLRVRVDGRPWTEVDDGTGVEKVGPFAIELPEQIVQINGTALSDPEVPDRAYFYRPFEPPVSRAQAFAFRVILNLEEGHTLLARFDGLIPGMTATATAEATSEGEGEEQEEEPQPPEGEGEGEGGQ
ncbi:MAG: hypothetical protein R3F62_29040 [Planctomycetota bacterium]